MRYAAELEWREPSHLEELLAMVGDIPRGTLTVLDDNLVHTSEVKNGELMTPRGMWAYCAKWVMTQLHNEAKCSKKVRTKVLAIPSLGVNG